MLRAFSALVPTNSYEMYTIRWFAATTKRPTVARLRRYNAKWKPNVYRLYADCLIKAFACDHPRKNSNETLAIVRDFGLTPTTGTQFREYANARTAPERTYTYAYIRAYSRVVSLRTSNHIATGSAPVISDYRARVSKFKRLNKWSLPRGFFRRRRARRPDNNTVM